MNRLSSKDLERLNTWTPEIANRLRPDAPVKQQPDGSIRIGSKGALVIGPASGIWYDHEASKGGANALSLIRHFLGSGSDPMAWADEFLEGKTEDGPLTHNSECCEETQAAFEARADCARHLLKASQLTVFTVVCLCRMIWICQ